MPTARRDLGNRARIEPLAHADAKSEVIIARIVGDRPGAVYSLPVLRLRDHWVPNPAELHGGYRPNTVPFLTLVTLECTPVDIVMSVVEANRSVYPSRVLCLRDQT